jgi:hypothetical protein
MWNNGRGDNLGTVCQTSEFTGLASGRGTSPGAWEASGARGIGCAVHWERDICRNPQKWDQQRRGDGKSWINPQEDALLCQIVAKTFADYSVIPIPVGGSMPLKYHISMAANEIIAIGKEKESQNILQVN